MSEMLTIVPDRDEAEPCEHRDDQAVDWPGLTTRRQATPVNAARFMVVARGGTR